MYLIGIDIGTGSTKGVAIDPEGNILASSQVPYPTINHTPGVSEQAPEIIWQAFLKCVNRITTVLTEAPAAICLSSAMHSVIPVDNDGTALANMITWADHRSSAVASRIKDSLRGKAIYEATGTPIHAMSPLCKITWLRESMPELFSRTARFISIKEFIWHRLFKVFEIDYSIASATGLFNITSLEWNEESLTIAGLTNKHLSQPVNTDYFRKGFDKALEGQLALPSETPFMIGGSDGCLANEGSFATKPGRAALTIGTSGAIRVAGTSPVLNWSQMTFNYRLNEKMFVSGGPINNGGVALKWYAKTLLKKPLETAADYDQLLQPIANIPAGSEGLIFLPYILGERAPIWNSNACGVFFGITAQHQQEHFTRAVIEGIVFSLYQIGRGIEAAGQPIEQIHVSGGFVRSKEWVQVLANVFGKKIFLVNTEDASAIGAAFLGMKAMDVKGTFADFNANEATVFLPDMKEHIHYAEHVFPVYEQLYKSLNLDMEILRQLKTGQPVHY
jgi:gluconokinase